MPPALPVDDEPRAFPSSASDDRYGGMALRDWFAGQALVEIASLIMVGKPNTYTVCARLAYELADAMMAERARRHD